MRPGAAKLAALLVGSLLARPAGAQVTVTMDAGGGNARIDQAGNGSIALVAPAVAWRHPLMSFDAGGVYSGMGDRGWNAAGAAAARLRSPRLGLLRGELSGLYRRSAHAVGQGTRVAEAELGLTASPASWAEVSVAGKVGSASALRRTRPVAGARLAARAVLQGVHLTLGVDRTSFTEERLRPGAVFDSLGSRQDTLLQRSVIEYTDASLGARWRAGSFELGGSIARRLGVTAVRATSWSLSATRWLTPQLALVGGTGHYAADLASSLPAGRYATLALRIGVGAGGSPSPVPAPASDASGSTRLRRGADGLVALDVRAPGARSVELMGDFTDWSAVELARRGSSQWQVRLPVPPGIHHLVVRIDGGEWRAPPGSRPTVNEYGVAVGAVLVD
jgi:hypothetical protein